MQDTPGAPSPSSPLTPPYAAFVAFESLVQKATREPIPAAVDKSLLIEWGIAAGNESAVLTTLRSLSLVDDNGRPTDLYSDLRLSTPRRLAALRRAAEAAYPGLSATDAVGPDDDQLHDYFVEKRGLRGQMVDKAKRFYRQLQSRINAAPPGPDLPPSGTPAPGRRSSRVTVVETSPNALSALRPVVERSPRHQRRRSTHAVTDATDALSPTLLIQIPLNADEKDLTELFRKVRRAWRRSAEPI